MSDDMSMGLPSSAGEHGVLRSMQEVAMSSQEASKMLRTYNIAWWGNNYYDVNELGHISVCPNPSGLRIKGHTTGLCARAVFRYWEEGRIVRASRR